eukprot:3253725-Amphidinium_carterae.1
MLLVVTNAIANPQCHIQVCPTRLRANAVSNRVNCRQVLAEARKDLVLSFPDTTLSHFAFYCLISFYILRESASIDMCEDIPLRLLQEHRTIRSTGHRFTLQRGLIKYRTAPVPALLRRSRACVSHIVKFERP